KQTPEKPLPPIWAPGGLSARFHEPDPINFDEHEGFVSLFDGKSLADWEGDMKTWRVEDGAIVGESTKEKPRANSFLSRKGIVAHDFDLKLEIKVENGGGSGIQYRSQIGKPWIRMKPGTKGLNLAWLMTGPQADYWYPVSNHAFGFTGQFYSENTELGIL